MAFKNRNGPSTSIPLKNRVQIHSHYDVTPDGQRFVVIKEGATLNQTSPGHPPP
jgi:hypothetical protein